MHKPRRPERSSDAPSASGLPLPEAEHQGQRRHNPVVARRKAIVSDCQAAPALPPTSSRHGCATARLRCHERNRRGSAQPDDRVVAEALASSAPPMNTIVRATKAR